MLHGLFPKCVSNTPDDVGSAASSPTASTSDIKYVSLIDDFRRIGAKSLHQDSKNTLWIRLGNYCKKYRYAIILITTLASIPVFIVALNITPTTDQVISFH